MSQKLLSETQVSELWGIARVTLQSWRYAGKGPAFIKLGSRVFYRPAALEAFLQEQTVECAS